MGKKVSILVDINVVMDVVDHRQPFYEESARVLDAVAYQQVNGLLAAHSVTTLFYIINRLQNRTTAVSTITNLLNNFTVATTDDNAIRTALAWNWKDFEDAVQMSTAVNANADYIISRNPRDFEHRLVPVLQPAALLALLSQID